MKTIRTAVLLLLAAEAVWAFEPRWRWRNDDGDIVLAAWKDSVNCPIVGHNGETLRLRTAVVPCDVAPADTPVTVTLRFSGNPYYDWENALQWTPVTRADTGAFFLSDSKYLDDGAWHRDNAVLAIWENAVKYLGTIAIDTSSYYPLASKPHNGGYEFEYCLKANAKMPEGSVYYFVSFLNEGIGPYDPDPPCVRFPPFYWSYHKVRTGEIINVQFTDSLNGWYQAYADNGYGLWRTMDGGRTWARRSSQLSPCPFFFTARDTGWAVVDNRISRSTDGGATWIARDSGWVVRRYLPNSIYFFDSQHGWVTCQDDPMMRTSDGGATWEPINSPAAYLLSSCFLTERIGFAIGESIYKTTDGGRSWRLVQSVYDLSQEPRPAFDVPTNRRPERIHDQLLPYVGMIQFVDSSLGWALTYNGKLCRTVDGGDHWTLQQTFRTPRALAMHFSDRLNGWIAGERGTILATKDGGATWEKRPSGTGHDLRAIEAVKDHLWIGAKDGTMLSSETGGWTTPADEERAMPVPQTVVLYPNYPNPFNPSTTIRYALPRSVHVRLCIYDMLGRMVGTLVDETKPPGVHEAVWNASHLASGIYFFRIAAGSFVQTRMMGLVK